MGVVRGGVLQGTPVIKLHLYHCPGKHLATVLSSVNDVTVATSIVFWASSGEHSCGLKSPQLAFKGVHMTQETAVYSQFLTVFVLS